MGRRKLEIKRIEEKSCRQVAFCKRRKGLMKKARELSILCDVDMAVVILSNHGRLHEFSSTNRGFPFGISEEGIFNGLVRNVMPKERLNTMKYVQNFLMTGILQRYESHVEAEKESSAKIQDVEHSKYSSMTMGELLQTMERQLEETNADGVAVTDLIHLENELQTTLTQIRSRKTHLMLESVKDLHEKEKLLREEKKLLEDNRAMTKRNRKVSDLPPPHIICGQQRVTLNFL